MHPEVVDESSNTSGHYPYTEFISNKFGRSEQAANVFKTDVFARAVDILEVLADYKQIPSESQSSSDIKNAPQSDNYVFYKKNSSIFKWQEKTLHFLSHSLPILGNPNINRALQAALGPEATRPTMAEFSDRIKPPPPYVFRPISPAL
jgi:hypothetical protein